MKKRCLKLETFLLFVVYMIINMFSLLTNIRLRKQGQPPKQPPSFNAFAVIPWTPDNDAKEAVLDSIIWFKDVSLKVPENGSEFSKLSIFSKQTKNLKCLRFGTLETGDRIFKTISSLHLQNKTRHHNIQPSGRIWDIATGWNHPGSDQLVKKKNSWIHQGMQTKVRRLNTGYKIPLVPLLNKYKDSKMIVYLLLRMSMPRLERRFPGWKCIEQVSPPYLLGDITKCANPNGLNGTLKTSPI